MRKVRGIVTVISDKKISIGGDFETLDKLRKLIKPEYKHPLTDDNKVIINVSDAYKILPNIDGEKITAWVNVRNYSFISKFEHNKDEVIKGWSLSLIKIERGYI